jgi:CubicO group peptidase (beta-lactamase class C family)
MERLSRRGADRSLDARHADQRLVDDEGDCGHSGWGGSFGCADPDAKVGIGYAMNQMGADLVGDPRANGLCAAIFACL